MCDPPMELLDHFMKKMNQSEVVDVLIMAGDFIGHSIPIEVSDPDQPELYQLLEDLHK